MRVHPAWTSVLLATNEALEVRELPGASGGPTLLPLKWRRDNIQVTAAVFIAQGNMIAVSDRCDRLLLLNYHGLHAAKRCALPWANPLAAAPPVSLAAGDQRDPIYHGVPTVTALVECPDVARAEEWRSGVSLLAVASSRGEVLLIKI